MCNSHLMLWVTREGIANVLLLAFSFEKLVTLNEVYTSDITVIISTKEKKDSILQQDRNT